MGITGLYRETPDAAPEVERFVNPLFDRYITIVEGEGKWA